MLLYNAKMSPMTTGWKMTVPIQDKCVDEFMGEESFMTTTSELFWTLGLLLSIVGIAFIIPLSVYLLLSWRKHRYGHY